MFKFGTHNHARCTPLVRRGRCRQGERVWRLGTRTTMRRRLPSGLGRARRQSAPQVADGCGEAVATCLDPLKQGPEIALLLLCPSPCQTHKRLPSKKSAPSYVTRDLWQSSIVLWLRCRVMCTRWHFVGKGHRLYPHHLLHHSLQAILVVRTMKVKVEAI